MPFLGLSTCSISPEINPLTHAPISMKLCTLVLFSLFRHKRSRPGVPQHAARSNIFRKCETRYQIPHRIRTGPRLQPRAPRAQVSRKEHDDENENEDYDDNNDENDAMTKTKTMTMTMTMRITMTIMIRTMQ